MDGLEVCTRIRQSKTVKKDPFIIMITGKGSEVDRIVGYATGADDYIPKPFSSQELIVRIRALLRRTMRHQPEYRMIETPHFLIDCEKREVLVQQDNGEIYQPDLTPSAFDLLVQLASYPKRVWTRAELVESMRGSDFLGEDRAIDVFACEDGHAQERALLSRVLATVMRGDLWIADRNFCNLGFLFGLHVRGAAFVIRQHGGLPWQAVTELVFVGQSETGAVFEQSIQLIFNDAEISAYYLADEVRWVYEGMMIAPSSP